MSRAVAKGPRLRSLRGSSCLGGSAGRAGSVFGRVRQPAVDPAVELTIQCAIFVTLHLTLVADEKTTRPDLLDSHRALGG